MVCPNPDDELSNEYSKDECRNAKTTTNYCQKSEQTFYTDHYLRKYQRKLQKHFEYVLRTHDLLSQKLKSLIIQLSATIIFDLIEQFYEFKIKSNEIEKAKNKTQQQLQDLSNEDKQQWITMTNGSKSDNYDNLKNDIRRLKKDIYQLKLKLEEINNNSQRMVSLEKSPIPNINIQSNDSMEITESPPDNISILGNNVKQQTNGTPLLSYLLLKQMSPSIIDLNENELDLTGVDNETYLKDEEEEPVAEVVSSDSTPKISQKVHLSNNIVSVLRGPAKAMVDSTMHAAEALAKAKQASEVVVRAVNQGLARQKQTTTEEQTINNSIKPAFAEITSDWIFEGENINQGFSSASIWMRNPQGQRILVKTQDLPICAANEWIAYALGRQIGLPINRVQIAIYKKNLVTLHTDVSQENEKTITLLDLSKRRRKILMTDPIIGSMDLFDRIIQNVDRNSRNILITTSNTTDIDDDTEKLKIYLIDHSACFGMGKLNGLSVMASKLRSRHLSVVKFDPIKQANKFDRYLSKLSTEDRILMGKTLNHFAAIKDNLFDNWLTEVQDLLTSSQYSRIYNVLYRQRDIAKRYMIQWGIYSRSSNIKSTEKNQIISEMNDLVTSF